MIIPAVSKKTDLNQVGTRYLWSASVPIKREERMLFHVGGICERLRKAEGFNETRIAGILDVGSDTVRNFELGRQWPKKAGLEETLDLYVEFCAVDSRLEIWQMALADLEAATRAASGSPDGLVDDPLLQDKTRPTSRKAAQAPKKRAKRRRPA